MPLDTALVPGAQDSNTRILQRVAALESQVRALSIAKQTTVQPISASIQTPGPTTTPATFTWRGGRVWIVLAGVGVYVSAGLATFGGVATINGVPLSAYALNGVGTTGPIYAPTGSWMIELNPSTYALAPTNTLSFSTSGFFGAPQLIANALVIEWPVP